MAIAPIYIPTHSVPGFPFLPLLTSFAILLCFAFVAIPPAVKYYFIVALILIFLISDAPSYIPVDHLCVFF